LTRWLGSTGSRRKANFWLFLAYKLVGDAMLVYLIQSDWLAWVSEGAAYDVLQVLWPAMLILGVAPAIAMERAMSSMAGAPEIELARVARGARGALIIACGLVTFASVNFVSARWNKKADLSYFRTTAPSESTRALVESLSEPTEVFLFYPPGNEVLVRVQDYTDELAPLSGQLTVQTLDQALDPTLARELKVRKNGVIAFRSGKNTETLNVDIDFTNARTVLRKLDQEFQERLVKVSRPERIAYFTVGHLEREFGASRDAERAPVSDLKSLLEGLGFQCRRLGLSEGLGDAIPDDATLIVIAGAVEPMLDGERAAIRAFLEGGGGVLMFVDPDHGEPDAELLASMGIRVPKGLAADKESQIRAPGRPLSPYNFATNQTALHPMSSSFRNTSRRLFYATMGSGALKKVDKPPEGVTVRVVVRSRPGAFVDANGDRVRQTEEKEDENAALSLGVVAEFEGKGEKKGRAIVFGDADAASNTLIRNPGNAYLIVDGVRWLAHDEDVAKGAPTLEEDVKIMHRKDEDSLWFYGTTLASPALVLGLGLLYTFRRRRRHS
ncbi:MAG: DUF4350 domain-containing protein, partial [Myxococcota bacterium]